jgi:glyoxylase-like metal-dependent hydrolase (beta-lactamase superfamily II)
MIQLQVIEVGPFQVNCYLIFDEDSKDCIIVDPGAEPNRIASEVGKLGVTPRAILLTHGHADHIAGVKTLKEKFGVPLAIGNGEEELLKNPSSNISAMMGMHIVSPEPDQLLEDEQLLSFGSITFRVLATPGHSPAGVCFLHEEAGILICGDTLFAGSIGRTDLPGCSHDLLLRSIRTKILALPDSIVCYPGHGPSTTVGAERNSNPFLMGESFA